MEKGKGERERDRDHGSEFLRASHLTVAVAVDRSDSNDCDCEQNGAPESPQTNSDVTDFESWDVTGRGSVDSLECLPSFLNIFGNKIAPFFR